MARPNIIVIVPTSFGNGQHPSVCLHPTENIAVRVNMKWNDLYYSVGRVDKKRMALQWSPSDIRYTTGDFPSVSLVKIDGKLVVIEMHSSEHFKTCYYRLGEVDTENLTIDWWHQRSTEMCRGLKPKVCSKDDGTVIVINEESSAFNSIQYLIGRIHMNDKKIIWQDEDEKCRKILEITGVQPVVAINQNNSIAVVYRDGQTALKIIVGELNSYREVMWGKPSQFGTGTYPSVAINSHGNLVVLHQTKTMRKLYHNNGTLNPEDKTVSWSSVESLHYTSGRYPSVSMSNDGYMLITHETSLGYEMYYSQGLLKGQQQKETAADAPPSNLLLEEICEQYLKISNEEVSENEITHPLTSLGEHLDPEYKETDMQDPVVGCEEVSMSKEDHCDPKEEFDLVDEDGKIHGIIEA